MEEQIFLLNAEEVTQEEYQSIIHEQKIGVFTSFRMHCLRQHVRIVEFERHIRRLCYDAETLGLPRPDIDKINGSLTTLRSSFKRQAPFDVRIRIDIVDGYIGMRKISLNRGLIPVTKVVSLSSVSDARPCIRHKTFAGATASEQAQQKIPAIFDEALFINEDGAILEGAWSNFGWISGNKVFVSQFGLAGITQTVVPDLVTCISGLQYGGAKNILKISDLVNSGIKPFIMSSVRGIVPVAQIDNVQFSDWLEIIQLAEMYGNLLYGSHLKLDQ